MGGWESPPGRMMAVAPHHRLLTFVFFLSFLSSLWQTLQEPARTQLPLRSHSPGQRGGRRSPRPGDPVPTQPQKWEPQTWVSSYCFGTVVKWMGRAVEHFFYHLWHLLVVTVDWSQCPVVSWPFKPSLRSPCGSAESQFRVSWVGVAQQAPLSEEGRWVLKQKGNILTWLLSNPRPAPLFLSSRLSIHSCWHELGTSLGCVNSYRYSRYLLSHQEM